MTAPAVPPPTRSSRQPRLERLNALRGPAALLVVMYHVRQIALRDLASAGPFELWSFGHAGVDLFFVISGLVIYLVHRRDVGHPGETRRFLARRVVRVYPPLWIVTTLVLVAALTVSHAVRPEKMDVWFVVRSYLLIPIRGALPLLPPAWTLSHEMKFYLLFAMAIACPARVWRPVVAGVVIASVAVGALQLAGYTVAFPLDFIASPYNIEFAAGVAIGTVVLRSRLAGAQVVGVAGAILWIIAAAHDAPANAPDAAEVARFAVGSALVVLAVAARDLARPTFHAPLLRLLGDASYAIYLVHLPVIIAAIRVLRAYNVPPTLAPLSAVAVVATVAGIAFHLVIERPLTRALGARVAQRPAAGAVPA